LGIYFFLKIFYFFKRDEFKNGKWLVGYHIFGKYRKDCIRAIPEIKSPLKIWKIAIKKWIK